MREDFETGFKELLEQEICIGNSLLYIWYAVFLESKGRLNDANMIYELGLLRYLYLPLMGILLNTCMIMLVPYIF